jgi:hypothetical protein
MQPNFGQQGTRSLDLASDGIKALEHRDQIIRLLALPRTPCSQDLKGTRQCQHGGSYCPKVLF